MKNQQLVAAIAVALTGAFAMNSAQAATVASAESVVSFENFTINYTAGGAQLDTSNFQTLSVTSSELTAANMTGATGTTMNPSSSDGTPLVSSSKVGTVDPTITGFPTTTTTNFNVATMPFTGNFSASGSNEVGSPITDFPNSTSPVASKANLHNGSYASLDTLNGTAGTSSSSTISSTTQFKLGKGGFLTFNFDVGAYIAAYLSLGAAQSATAHWGVTFNITDQTDSTQGFGGLVGFFSTGDTISNNFPGSGASNTSSLNSTLNGDGTVHTTGKSFTTFVALNTTDTYLLTAAIDTRTQVERRVPEPETLALLGIGLLGLTFTSRKARMPRA